MDGCTKGYHGVKMTKTIAAVAATNWHSSYLLWPYIHAAKNDKADEEFDYQSK